MAEKIVHFSDLSGAMIEDPAQRIAMTVFQHPDLEQPAVLEAGPAELDQEQLDRLSIDAVVFDVLRPGEEAPQRYVMTPAKFATLAVGRKIDEVLADAK